MAYRVDWNRVDEQGRYSFLQVEYAHKLGDTVVLDDGEGTKCLCVVVGIVDNGPHGALLFLARITDRIT